MVPCYFRDSFQTPLSVPPFSGYLLQQTFSNTHNRRPCQLQPTRVARLLPTRTRLTIISSFQKGRLTSEAAHPCNGVQCIIGQAHSSHQYRPILLCIRSSAKSNALQPLKSRRHSHFCTSLLLYIPRKSRHYKRTLGRTAPSVRIAAQCNEGKKPSLACFTLNYRAGNRIRHPSLTNVYFPQKLPFPAVPRQLLRCTRVHVY